MYVRIQVKGICVDEFRDNESFPIDTIFLKNALSEGFIFFVVEIKEDGSSKIFYRTMAPIEIRSELSKLIDGQKTKTLYFNELTNDKDYIAIELEEFLNDCIKQKSFANKDRFLIEDLKKISEYHLGFSIIGKKENFLKDIFNGVNSFLYVKTREGAEIPIGNSRMLVIIPEIRTTQNELVKIGDDIISITYNLIYSKKFISYEIPNLLSFKILNDRHIIEDNLTIDILAKTTDEYIKALKIFLQILKVKIICFGENSYTLKTDKINHIIPEIEKKFSDFKKHSEVVKILNIRTCIDYESFSENDNISLCQLYKALIEHLPIELNKPKHFFKLHIANICIILACRSDNNGKFYIDDFFKTIKIGVTKGSEDNLFEVPTFSFIGKTGFVLFDNIPYEEILDSYKRLAAKDIRVLGQANLDLLEMIKAADELEVKLHLNKRELTLSAAKTLAQWLIETNEENSLKHIHLINYLQIVKRLRNLTDEENKSLVIMTQSSECRVRAAANILLGNIDIADYIIENMEEDDKKEFIHFPIYNLARKQSRIK